MSYTQSGSKQWANGPKARAFNKMSYRPIQRIGVVAGQRVREPWR